MTIPRQLMFMMTGITQHMPQTGAMVTTQISKGGGAFMPTHNNATEVGDGVYCLNLSAAELSTTDAVFLRATAPNCNDMGLYILNQQGEDNALITTIAKKVESGELKIDEELMASIPAEHRHIITQAVVRRKLKEF